jgi:BirA family biotin operon repressor/biotin-[acetyl-CoA-carboxylase] ligase
VVGFDLERARALCQERVIFAAARLEFRASTDSTNDDVLALAQGGAPHGTALVAAEQKKGRGRHGAVWFAPPGDNLTFSVLLRPELRATECTVLPLLAGLAVREAVAARVVQPVSIKWPNDVWVDGKKVAGILVESVMRGERLKAAVVGIGINVRSTVFPPEIATTTTSLALEEASELDCSSLFADVLASLERRARNLVAAGFGEQLEELTCFDGLLGRKVSVEGVRGTAAGIGEGGELLVRSERGMERCIAGSVTLEG